METKASTKFFDGYMHLRFVDFVSNEQVAAVFDYLRGKFADLRTEDMEITRVGITVNLYHYSYDENFSVETMMIELREQIKGVTAIDSNGVFAEEE